MSQIRFPNLWKTMLILSLILSTSAGCARSEMQQERQEDILDEQEDRHLNSPGVEMRQERREDRLDELEDRQLGPQKQPMQQPVHPR